MILWAAVFLVIAILAATLGFGGIATASTNMARILFFLTLVMMFISFVTGIVRRV